MTTSPLSAESVTVSPGVRLNVKSGAGSPSSTTLDLPPSRRRRRARVSRRGSRRRAFRLPFGAGRERIRAAASATALSSSTPSTNGTCRWRPARRRPKLSRADRDDRGGHGGRSSRRVPRSARPQRSPFSARSWSASSTPAARSSPSTLERFARTRPHGGSPRRCLGWSPNTIGV